VLHAVPAAIVLLAAFAIRNRSAAAAFSCIGFGLLTYSAQLPTVRPPHNGQEMYRQVTAARERIEAQRQGRPIRFWYRETEAASDEFLALSSTYLFEYTLLSNHFPDLPANAPLEPGMVVALLSGDGLAPERALTALKKRGWDATVTDTGAFGGGESRFHVFMLSPQFDRAASAPQMAVLDARNEKGRLVFRTEGVTGPAFPPEGWILVDFPRASMRRLQEGTLIKTTNRSYDYAARYALLTAPATGDYHFDLRFTPIIGDIAFGAMTGDESRWLASSSISLRAQLTSIIGFTVHLGQGQQFRLMVSNRHAHDQPSQVVLREMFATFTKPGLAGS
jgi:hypothetical protein